MNNVRYAGFWIRALAQLLDFIILFLPLFLPLYFISGGSLFNVEALQQTIMVLNEPTSASPFLYAKPLPEVVNSQYELLLEGLLFLTVILFWNKMKGATPGKKICHIAIKDATTFGDISNAQAIIRYIGYLASSLLLGYGFFMAAFRKDKRSLHDLMAGTVVVYEA